MPTRLGLDTGFFFRLLAGHPEAVRVWGSVLDGDAVGVVSCVSFYELRRASLRGALGPDETAALLDGLPELCVVVWLDEATQMDRAARHAHGTGLAMADALILTSLLDGGAETVYTTDSDFERCRDLVPVVLM